MGIHSLQFLKMPKVLESTESSSEITHVRLLEDNKNEGRDCVLDLETGR